MSDSAATKMRSPLTTVRMVSVHCVLALGAAPSSAAGAPSTIAAPAGISLAEATGFDFDLRAAHLFDGFRQILRGRVQRRVLFQFGGVNAGDFRLAFFHDDDIGATLAGDDNRQRGRG